MKKNLLLIRLLVMLMAILTIQLCKAQSISYQQSYELRDGASYDGFVNNVGKNDLILSPDGTKFYTVANNQVTQFSVTTPYDLTSGITSDGSYNFVAQESGAQGLTFSNDGLKMFVTGYISDAVHEYTLSTAFDVLSTVTYAGSPFDVSGQDTAPYDVSFSTDGLTMFVMGFNSDRIYQYDLTTPFTVTSGVSYSGTSFSYAAVDGNSRGFEFSENGKHLFHTGFTGNVYQYNLSTPFDLSGTVELIDNELRVSEVATALTLTFSSNGAYVYVMELSQSKTHQYQLSTGTFSENSRNDGTFETSVGLQISGETFTNAGGALTSGTDFSIDNLPSGLTPSIAVGDNGKYGVLTLTGTANNHQNVNDVADLQFTFRNSAFSGGNAAAVGNATMANSGIPMDFDDNNPEILYSGAFELFDATFQGSGFISGSYTGMTFNNDGSQMFVTTNFDRVYEIIPGENYQVTEGLSFGDTYRSTEVNRIQDINFNADGTKMYLLDNNIASVAQYALSTPFDVTTASFEVLYDFSAQESSPTVMAFNDTGTKVFIGGFTTDAIHQYTLSTAFDLQSTVTYAGSPFLTAGEDTSIKDVVFAEGGTKMFAVGSTDVFLYTLDVPYDITTGVEFSSSLDISVQESSPIGLFVTPDGNTLHVQGFSSSFRQYELGKTTLSEVAENNGEVSDVLNIFIRDEFFTNAGGTLTLNTDYSIANLPTGLTPSLSVAADGLSATLSLAGAANDHQDSDNVASLEFDFENSAFAGGDASAVADASMAASGVGIDFEDNNSILSYGYFFNTLNGGTLGNSYDFNADDSNVQGVAFSDDGLKLFLIGNTNDAVIQYSLPAPFDIGNVTMDGSFSIAAQDNVPLDITFNPTGDKMYIPGLTNDEIYQYSLSTPFDITSGVTFDGVSGSTPINPRAVQFDEDGTTMFLIAGIGSSHRIYQYEVSTAYDITSTLTLEGNFNPTSEDLNPTGLVFHENGFLLSMIGLNDFVFTYQLTKPYDITETITLAGSFDMNAVLSGASGIAYSSAGDKLFVPTTNSKKLFEYNLNIGGFEETTANEGDIQGSIEISLFDGLFANPGGTLTTPTDYVVSGLPAGFTPTLSVAADGASVTMTIAGNTSNHQDANDVAGLTFTFNTSAFQALDASLIKNTSAFNSGLGINFNDNYPILTYGDAFSITNGGTTSSGLGTVSSEAPSPNGMTFSTDGTKMFVINNNGDNLNQYTLNTPFDLSGGYSFDGSPLDLSGQTDDPVNVAFSPDGMKMFVATGVGGDIYQYTLTNAFDITSGVSLNSTFSGFVQTSLTAAIFSREGNRMFLLSGQDIYQFSLDNPFDLSSGVVADGVTLDIQSEVPSPRDLLLSQDGTKLLVLDASGRDITQYNLSIPNNLSSGVTLAGTILDIEDQTTNPRAMAFNDNGDRLFFLGTSPTNQLYQTDLSIGSFTETEVNDGEVENTLTINIFDDQFTSAGSTLTVGTDYSITDLPAGLAPVMSVAADGTSAILTLSGNANDHQEIHSISGLEFTFENSAFETYDANEVGNATSTNSNVPVSFDDNHPALTYGFFYDFENASHDGSPFSVNSQDDIPTNLTFSEDGTKLFVTGRRNDAIYQYDLSTPFETTSGVSFDGSLDISVETRDATDLQFSPDGMTLMVLSDNISSNFGSLIAQYSLTQAFDITSGVSYSGNSFDVSGRITQPSGFAFNNDGTQVFITGGFHTDNYVYYYNLNNAFDLSGGATYVDRFEHEVTSESLQDISFNNNGTVMFIMTSPITDKIDQFTLGSAFDLSGSVALETSFSVSSEEDFPQGFVFGPSGSQLFVMGGTGKEVNQYSLTSEGFLENSANNGAVDGSLTIRMIDDFFTSPGGSLATPTNYTIDNLPAGLIPNLAVAANGRTADLTFSGNATDHLDASDLTSLQFTFENSAFVNSDASEVAQAIATSSGVGIDFLANSDTDILTFALTEETGTATINNTTHTVDIEVVFGTDISSLSPTLTLSDGANASPGSGIAQDFSSPVTYTLTAEDGTSTQDWTATVTIAPNTENDVTTFTFNEIDGAATINTTNHTVVASAVAGTDISSITPTITLSENATSVPNSGITQDFSSQVTYIVTAEDGTPQAWGVTITETLATPTDLAISTDNIDENQISGTTVGNFSSTDASFNDSHTYSLVSGDGDDNNGSFTISGDGLVTGFSGDFETQSIYQIRVQTDDGNGGQFEKALIININNVNEGPTDLELTGLTIDESSNAGTTIGSFSTTDEDTDDSFTYTLVSGTGDTDNASFNIVGDELVSTLVFDFETQNSYSIRVQSEDEGGLTIAESYTIQINDLPPQVTSLTLDPASVAENEVTGSVVGSFTTLGEDLSGSYSYSLVSGSGDDDNASFSVSGDELLTAATFNFELDASYNVRVKTDDGAGNTLESEISISITDVFESTDANISSFVLTEQTGSATIDATNQTVVIEVARGTDLSDLTPTITISNNATISPLTGVSQDFSDPFTYTVTAEDGTTTLDWVVTVTEAPNTETDILSFTLADQASEAIIDAGAHTIAISVVHGTDQTTLSPAITLSEGATISPESGAIQDLSEATTYTVTPEDGTTTQDWSITVSEAPNTATDILTFVLAEQTGNASIDATAHTVTIEVERGTDLTQLSPTITLSEDASIDPMSGTELDLSTETTYTVTAEDGATTQDWTITVTEALNTETDILSFSMAEETGSAIIDLTEHTVTIEVAHGTDLSNLTPTLSLSDGASVDPESGTAQDFRSAITYMVTAEDGTTSQDWTITVSEAPNTETDILTFVLAEETGNATIDATEHSVTIEVAYRTDLTELSPTLTLSEGATSDPNSGTAQDFSTAATYTITAEDGTTTQDWTINVTTAPNSETDILSFSIPEQTGSATIDASEHSITIEVSYETDPSGLTPTFTLSEGASADPASGTVQDFSTAVTYTITAEDGITTQDWIVNVMEAPSNETDILSFMLDEASGEAAIDATEHTVMIEVVNGTDLTNLTPTLTLSAGATVRPNNGSTQDFSTAQTYTVTAEDGTTTQDWTVTVTEALRTGTNIRSFILAEATGDATINTNAHTVEIEVATGTNLSALTPTITISAGASINPGSGVSQDFTEPVSYLVTAENGSSQRWTVSVSTALNTETDILSFELTEQTGTATIDPDAHTVNIEVRTNTDLSLLSPEITISEGATIAPASQEAIDFSSPVTYTVTAEDGQTQQDWIVTVTNALALNTSSEIDLQIYPNPATQWLHIRQAPYDASIALFNSAGKLVKSERYTRDMKIDLRDLPAGIYHLRIHDPSTAKIHNNKIIKR